MATALAGGGAKLTAAVERPSVSTVESSSGTPESVLRAGLGGILALDEQKILHVLPLVLAIRKTTTRAAPGDAGAHVETRPVRQPCRCKQGIRGSDVDAV